MAFSAQKLLWKISDYWRDSFAFSVATCGYRLSTTCGNGTQWFDWQVFISVVWLIFGFSWKGAVLSSAVVAFPLVVRAIRLSLENIDIKLEQAAQTLGASAWRVFFTITLPLSLPGVLAGLVLGFARSLGEFGATITFVSNIAGETQTIPLAMYSFIQTPGAEEQTARIYVLFAIILSLISLLLSEWLSKRMQKKLGQGKCCRLM